MSPVPWNLTLSVVAVCVIGGCGFLSGGNEDRKASGASQGVRQDRDSQSTQLDSNPVVATVGPLEIRLVELTDLSAPSETAATNLQTATASTQNRSRIRKRFLEGMIERRLLVLGSAKSPEWVTDASWEAEVQRRLAAIGPDEMQRRQVLAGIPKETFFGDFRKHVREEMMKDAILAREVEAKLEIAVEELRRRYENDRETAYYRPPAWGVYRFTRLVPKDRTLDSGELEEQVERIHEQVASRISSATNPRGMAKSMQETVGELLDPSLDEAGHAYIYDTREADFDPALKSHVRSCIVGDLSPVFELAGDGEKRGYCFYLPYSHQPAEQAPFERVKRLLKGVIRQEKKKELTDQLFDRLKLEFPVEIHSEFLNLDPPKAQLKET